MAQEIQTSLGQKRVIVIPIDDSEHSDHAFDFYVENLKKDDDFVCLLHVPETTDLSLANPSSADRELKKLHDQVEALEKKWSSKLQERQIEGKFRTGQGKPGEVVCDLAEKEGATMIVMGTRGQGKIRRTFLGSVSDYVVHHTHIPVTVCRRDDHSKHQKKA